MTLPQTFRRKMRLAMEATLPKRVMALVEFLYPPGLFISRLKQHLRLRAYQAATANLASDVVLFESAYAVRVSPEAKSSYENFCWCDDRMVVEIKNFLRLVRDKKCLYDIGSLHGVFSFSFTAATGGQAFAFEPSPSAAKVLHDVQALNPQLKVDHQPMAMGRHSGELLMRMEWQHLVAVPVGEGSDGCLSIEVQTVDQFVAQHPPPDCMKIDVEGYEYEVLQGASQALRQHRPLLFLEIHPVQLKSNGTSVREVIEYLRSFDYEILNAELRPFVFASASNPQNEIFNIICR